MLKYKLHNINVENSETYNRVQIFFDELKICNKTTTFIILSDLLLLTIINIL